ncbi:MAG: energy-coupling factor ABC transporter permease [Gemmataceae bacterium]
MLPPLFAVHLSDGVVTWPWILGGFALAVTLIALSLFRISDEEIPRIGMLSAAIFIGSQIHFHLGITSVHLLLNGLAGVLLGKRSTLAIAVGLTLQAVLFGHGGKWTWGLNVCILSLPALLAGVSFTPLYRGLAALPSAIRFICLSAIFAFCLTLTTMAVQLVTWKINGEHARERLENVSNIWVTQPAIILLLVVIAIGVSALSMRHRRTDAFTAGLLLGLLTGVMTVSLNSLTILLGGIDGVRATAAIAFLAHVPVMVMEALGVATIVAYLMRVKPEWLIGHRVESPGGTG